MPLQRTDEATAFTDPGTLSVVFQMTDPEKQSVRVTVQAGVLQSSRVAQIRCQPSRSIEKRSRASLVTSSTSRAAH